MPGTGCFEFRVQGFDTQLKINKLLLFTAGSIYL